MGRDEGSVDPMPRQGVYHGKPWLQVGLQKLAGPIVVES